MPTKTFIEFVFTSDTAEWRNRSVPSVLIWRDEVLPKLTAWTEPLERAMVGGFMADRLAFAFLAAYQAALQKHFPFLNPTQLSAFCVSEQGGSKPKAMNTLLRAEKQGYLINGAKTFVTCADNAQCLLVAVRDALSDAERPQIKIVVLDAKAAGVCVEEDKVLPFMPELQRGRLQLRDCYCPIEAVLSGDGYALHVKPFSPLEAFFVMAAGVGYLLALARQYDWPDVFVEQCVCLLHAIQSADFDRPENSVNQLLLNALRQQLRALVEQTEQAQFWHKVDEDTKTRWLRDKSMLMFSDRAHTIRLERAWQQLRAIEKK